MKQLLYMQESGLLVKTRDLDVHMKKSVPWHGDKAVTAY